MMNANRAAFRLLPSACSVRRSWWLPLLVYVPLTLGLTWPLVTRWTAHLPGGPHKDGLEDAYQNVWNLWWMKEALLRPTTPFVTDRFFYPQLPNTTTSFGNRRWYP